MEPNIHPTVYTIPSKTVRNIADDEPVSTGCLNFFTKCGLAAGPWF